MKCLCGYKHDEYNHDTDELESNGVKGFIAIKNIIPTIRKDINYGIYHYQHVTIYACPECGTLKIDV